MGPLHLHYWPCVLAGTLLGAIAAWATWSNGAGDHRDGVWRPGMSRSQFETCLRLSRIPNAPPVFRDLVIYPAGADGTVYVAGSYLPALDKPNRYCAFELRARHNETWGDAASLHSYLANNFPRVSFRYAWWTSPALTAALCFVASLLIFGFGMPLALGRALSGAQSAPPPVTAPNSATVDDAARRAEEVPAPEAHPIANVGPAIASAPPLQSDPLSATPLPDNQHPREFRGEFYPVARSGTGAPVRG